MAEELPTPASRTESYLAKAAGEDVTIPERPESRLEQYLNAIAEGGGGGGTSDFNELTNRPKYNGTTMTGETDIPAGPTVVQTIGTSTTDVMSQKAVTDMIHKNANDGNVRIGNGADASAVYSGVAVGRNAKATGQRSVSIGFNSKARGEEGVAIGYSAGSTQDGQGYSVSIGPSANGQKPYSVAIGAGSYAAAQGEFNIGTTGTNGYNSSAYRLITGVYDPQNAHDAATKGYVDGLVGDIETALNAINNGGNS